MSLSQENKILSIENKIYDFAESKGVYINLDWNGSSDLYIIWISRDDNSAPGSGKDVLNFIIDLARRFKIKVSLHVTNITINGKKVKNKKLENYYKKLGFESIKSDIFGISMELGVD